MVGAGAELFSPALAVTGEELLYKPGVELQPWGMGLTFPAPESNHCMYLYGSAAAECRAALR